MSREPSPVDPSSSATLASAVAALVALRTRCDELEAILADRGEPQVRPAAPGTGRGASTRRHRQVEEILVLVSLGDRERAIGLVAEHVAEFAGDAVALDPVRSWHTRSDIDASASGPSAPPIAPTPSPPPGPTGEQ